MKKKLLLLVLTAFLLPLSSCGKDVDAKINKVDLARLLSNEEINDVLEQVNTTYADKLSHVELNTADMGDDLVDYKSEASGTLTVDIKGDEYACSNYQEETKVDTSLYSYTNKEIRNRKIATFGNYNLIYQETYNDGQEDKKDETFSYSSIDSRTIAEVAISMPYSSSDISQATIGVDKKNNVYAVYYYENITTNQGRDKDGEDATFKSKSTYEVLANFGSLSDPKLTSFKKVQKLERNYDKELKIYNDYKLVESHVSSYKYEYKDRGNNEGKDDFINSLPDKSLVNTNFYEVMYYAGSGDAYSSYNVVNLNSASITRNVMAGSVTCTAQALFDRDYAYNFACMASVLELNKTLKTITISDAGFATVICNPHKDLDIVNVSAGIQAYKLKADVSSGNYKVKIVASYNKIEISIIK